VLAEMEKRRGQRISAIDQDADVVLVIMAPESENGPYEILIRKHCNGQSGCCVPVNFHGERMRFESIVPAIF
jgi:replicative DNA helicase